MVTKSENLKENTKFTFFFPKFPKNIFFQEQKILFVSQY